MKLVSIALGQAVRLFRAPDPIGGTYLPDSVTAIKERYGFLEVPTTLQDFDPSKGISFQHGKFPVNPRALPDGRAYKEIVIESFQIFNDGLVVGTKAFAEDADLFIDDIIEWAKNALRATIFETTPIQYAYNSQIEVSFSKSLTPLFEKINNINEQVTNALTGYGSIAPPPYQISGFSLHCDLTNMPPPRPGAFILERRAQQPYSSNLYFSAAPLKTADHLKILEEFEKILSL